jgi:hypothetical protein
VIDVNVPELITVSSDPSNPNAYEETEVEYASTTTDQARKEGEKLAAYLWENYVEPYEFPGYIFLMGAGHAFHAVAKLVSENGMSYPCVLTFFLPRFLTRSFLPITTCLPEIPAESIYPSLAGVIGFISTNPIRPVHNPNHPWVAQWYRENSRIYISHTHSLWKKDGRASKRYGQLIRSQGTVLNQMMKMHEEEVTRWIQEKVDLDNDDDDTESEDQSTGADGAAAAGLGESDADNLDDPALLAAGPSAPSSQQQQQQQQRQLLVPVVPPTNASVGDTTAAATSSEVRDVFMSTEQ